MHVDAETIQAVGTDVSDLSAALHMIGDAFDRRGDEDGRAMLRLLARFAEQIVAQVEAIVTAEEEQVRHRRGA
jgi:hypothetical protein